MTTREIAGKSILTEDRADSLIGILAIKNEDNFYISKMIEYANKGLSNVEILQAFINNKYWLHLEPMK